MSAKPGITAREAADRLSVSPARVRAMVQGGLLDGEKVGDLWLIEPESVDRRSEARLRQGRPLSARNAWALLWLASGDEELQGLAARWVSAWTRWHLAARVRREGWLSLAPRLRRRANVYRLRAHPGDLARLSAEPELVRTGVSAAREHALDLVAPGVFEAYVPAQALPKLTRKYLLEPSTSPNVILHVIDALWPFPEGRTVAPGLVTALDLLTAGDPRSRRASEEYLKGLAVS